MSKIVIPHEGQPWQVYLSAQSWSRQKWEEEDRLLVVSNNSIFYQGFYHVHWQITRQQEKGRSNSNPLYMRHMSRARTAESSPPQNSQDQESNQQPLALEFNSLTNNFKDCFSNKCKKSINWCQKFSVIDPGWHLHILHRHKATLLPWFYLKQQY